MSLGYPGIKGPDDPGPKEKTEPVKILGQDAVNTLVRRLDGRTEVVPNDRIRKSG